MEIKEFFQIIKNESQDFRMLFFAIIQELFKISFQSRFFLWLCVDVFLEIPILKFKKI